MRGDERWLVVFAIGVLLVSNPGLLPARDSGLKQEATYRAERIEGLPADPDFERAYLDCMDDESTDLVCLQVREVGYDDQLRVQNVSSNVLDHGHVHSDAKFVRFEAGFATLNSTVRNGDLLLKYVPVSRERVMKAFADHYKSLPSVGQRAIKNGEASITRYYEDTDAVENPLETQERYVERNGTYYHLRVVRYSVVPVKASWLDKAMWFSVVVVGLALAVFAKIRIGRLVTDD